MHNVHFISDSCFWTSPKSRTCSRQLINTDENILFILTRQNRCGVVYEVAIKKNDSVLFEANMTAKTRLKVTPRAVDKRLNENLREWYLSLSVDTENNTSHTKVSTPPARFCFPRFYCFCQCQCSWLIPLTFLCQSKASYTSY